MQENSSEKATENEDLQIIQNCKQDAIIKPKGEFTY